MMFFHQSLKGNLLPQRSVCLTYDDGPREAGPGASTLELAQYLFAEGISAAFFVVGKHVEQYPNVLPELVRLGHVIGNHTYSHVGLVDHLERGGDVINELVKTDLLLAPFIQAGRSYFRAPYGSWRSKTELVEMEVSFVANLLNDCRLLDHYTGPIGWDVSGEDYRYWEENRKPDECAEKYLELVEQMGRGIILLHDSSETEDGQKRNRSLELTNILVPLLKQRGYCFVPLNEIPL
jgi:peptidoglycan/xylan/chitin deacetylase (PgdA/CDA1 family)